MDRVQISDQYATHLRFSKATRGGDFDFPAGDDERKAIKTMLFGAASPMRPIQKEAENNEVGYLEKRAYTMPLLYTFVSLVGQIGSQPMGK